MSVRAWQVSHEEIKSELRVIEAQHSVLSSQISVQDERLKELDKQIEDFRQSKIPERLARVEETNELNKQLLIGIVIALLGLIGERVLMHLGGFRKV
jgi:prefoldin subunit 5